MNFTGTELGHFRNFYTQNNNFEVDVNCTIDNTTGHYVFGLTGSGPNLQIDLLSGKMYSNGLFIHSYVPYENFELQIQVTSGNYNIYKNGTPLVLGLSKPNYNYNQFFFNRQYNTDNANFDVSISGYNQPNLYISQNAYYLNTGQTSVTGEIINNGAYNYEIFTSNSSNSQSLYYSGISGTLLPGQTGSFIYSGNFANFNFNQPILTNLYTNYNYPTINFNIMNGTSGQIVVLQQITNYSLNNLNQLPLTVQYTNYNSGVIVNNFNTNFYLNLAFITGGATTGYMNNWNFYTGVDQSTLISLRLPGQYNNFAISGSGNFTPNSSFALRIDHATGITGEYIKLLISGKNIFNAQTGLIFN